MTLLRRALNDARTAQAFNHFFNPPEQTMKTYTGTKTLRAKPMTRGEYNALRGWDMPADENPADAGYLVEYLDGGKANHPDFENYISWSPADVFERTYTEGTASIIDPSTVAALQAWTRSHNEHRRNLELAMAPFLASGLTDGKEVGRARGEAVHAFINGLMLGYDPLATR